MHVALVQSLSVNYAESNSNIPKLLIQYHLATIHQENYFENKFCIWSFNVLFQLYLNCNLVFIDGNKSCVFKFIKRMSIISFPGYDDEVY